VNYYTIRHVTRFSYEVPVRESVMEARMQPRSEASQRCLHFGLTTSPASRVLRYQDHEGNIVHHFDIPGRHSRLTVTAEALVECLPLDYPVGVAVDEWDKVDAMTASGEFWDTLNPSTFARPTTRLDTLRQEIGVDRRDDPLTTLRRLMGEMYARFEYRPRSTRVDSPIDEALETRRGVCQDFAHIMIALVRPLGIPCRYVSGYLFHGPGSRDRSADGATHAWVEALVPSIGWVGLDPTNNLLAGDRHVLVAVGRDYADVPPTRGVFKGTSAVRSELLVSVRVGAADTTRMGDVVPFTPWMSREADGLSTDTESSVDQKQQQ
jgi:transglutaminase-like putative cysteine protease